MSVQQGRKTESSDSTIDNIIDYLKERIESPFLMSFIFSWSVINRDFLFYLFMSEDSNKHYQLAHWDFSAFMFNFNEFSWYSPWAESFWYPLFFGSLMTLFFSSASSLLSGGRYFFLKWCISFTKKHKDGYDTAYAINLEQKKIEVLKEQCSQLEQEIKARVEKNNFHLKESEHSKDIYLSSKRGEIADFLIESAKFAIRYKTDFYSESNIAQSSKLEPNSVIKISFSDRINDSKEIERFEGTVFDFITKDAYFDWNDGDSIAELNSLLARLEVSTDVICEIKQLGRVKCSLLEAQVYN